MSRDQDQKNNHSGKGMRAAIAICAAAILVCAGVLLGLHLGTESAGRAASSAESASAGSENQSTAVSSLTVSAADSSSGAAVWVEDSVSDASNEASETPGASSKPDSSGGTDSFTESTSSVGNSESESALSQTASSGTVAAAVVTPSPNGKIVCIDPGHQDHGMSDTEPNGPGSSTMKAKLTSGTSGSVSGKDEYEVNLEVSLRLRDELEKRGYTVVMTRETNDVEISNAERAQIANNAGADILIRIHCNSSEDSSVKGALAYVPSEGNPYLSAGVIEESRRLGQILLDSQCAVTGQNSRGLLEGDDMTGINWAQMPVTIIEMGFMSNPDEDRFLASEEGQNLIMIGLANGVDEYFN